MSNTGALSKGEMMARRRDWGACYPDALGT